MTVFIPRCSQLKRHAMYVCQISFILSFLTCILEKTNLNRRKIVHLYTEEKYLFCIPSVFQFEFRVFKTVIRPGLYCSVLRIRKHQKLWCIKEPVYSKIVFAAK
jgi:hypothetical protein